MSSIFSNPAYKKALALQQGYAADAFDNPLLTAADAARLGRPRQEQPQEPQAEEQPQEAPQERTYLGAAGDIALSGLAGLGNFLDVPGSSIRDIAAGRNPFDQWATPFSDANRTTGRDLNRMYGLSGKDDTWGNFWGGLGTEIALDPLSYFGAGLLSKAAKGVGKASKAAGLTKGLKSKVNQSLARQAKTASKSTPNVMPMSNSVADATAAVAKEAPKELSYFPALARATPGALINSAEDPVEALAKFYRVGGTDDMLDKPVYSIGSAEIPIAQWIPWLKDTWMGKTAEVVSKKPVIEAIDESVKRKARDILAAEAATGAAKAGKGAAAAAKAAGVAAAQAADQIPTAQAGKEAAATVDNAADQTIPTPTTQAADNVVDDANTPASQEVPDAELKASNESRFSTKDFLREAKEHPVVKQSIEESGEAGIFNTIKSVLSQAKQSAGSSKVNFNNILSALYSGSIDATDDTLDNISNILFDANENMLKKSSPSGKPATKTSKASKANNASGSPIQLPDSISPENLEKLKNQETWLSPEQVQRRNAALAKQAIPDVPVKYSSAQEAVGALERFRDGVTIDGINIKAVPYSGANDANPLGSLVADGGTRPMVVMEIDGVKIPFYQSTGDGGKILQRGAWYPFFGFHKDSQWINKADASGMSQYYGSRKLAKTAQALDEATGNITPLTDVGKRSEFRKATFDAGIFGTPDFLKWINDGMSPVSDTAPNKVFMANIENTIKKLEGEDWGKSPTPTKQTAPKASVATGAGKAAVNAVETAAPNNFRMEDYLNGVKQHEVVQQALTEPGGEALFDVIDDILANANKRAKTPSLSFVDDIIPAIDEVKKNPAIHEDLIEEANQVLANVHDDMAKASDASKQSPPVKQAAIPDAESVMQKFVENGKQAPWLARHEIRAFAGKGAKSKTEAAIQSLVDSGQLQVAYDSKGAAHYALPDTPITEWLATSKDGVNNLPTKKQATRNAERAAQQAAETVDNAAAATTPSAIDTAANTATQAGKIADEVIEPVASTADEPKVAATQADVSSEPQIASTAQSVAAAESRDTVMGRYSQQVKKRQGFSGKKQILEVLGNDNKPVKRSGTVIGDTGFAIIYRVDDKGKKSTEIVHLNTGLAVTSGGSINDQKILAYMLADSGADLSFRTAEAMPKDSRSKMKEVVAAWMRNDYSGLSDDVFDNLAKKVEPTSSKKATFTVDMSHIEPTSPRKAAYAQKVAPLVKSLAKEVPEFSNNPILTVNEKGNLVYRDHFQYEFPQEAILPKDVSLSQGETVTFNLSDFGIKTKENAEVVSDSLRNIGFSVRKGKDGLTASFQGTSLKITGNGTQWSVSGGDGTYARQLADRQISGIAWSQPPIAPLQQIQETTSLETVAKVKGKKNVRGKVQEANKQTEVPGSERPEGTSSVDRPQETGQGGVPEASGAGTQAQVAEGFTPQFTDGKLDMPKTDVLFDRISPKHATLNVRLTSLVKQGLMTDHEKLFVQGFFSESDLRNMPDYIDVGPYDKNIFESVTGQKFKPNATGAFARMGSEKPYAMFIRRDDVVWTEKQFTVIHELAHGIFYELERKDPALFNEAIDSISQLIQQGKFDKYFDGTEIDKNFAKYLSSNPHEVLAQLLVHISANKAEKMDKSIYRLAKAAWDRISEYISRIIHAEVKYKDKGQIAVIKDLVRYSAGFIEEAKRDEIMDSLLRIKKKSQGTYTTPSVMHSALAGAGRSQVAEATREWMQKGVRSSFFKNWFGDWESDAANASKVVDADGKPLVVYHGTGVDFNSFETKRNVHGHAMFTEAPKVANYFAYNPPIEDLYKSTAPRIIPVYLSLKNPWQFDNPQHIEHVFNHILKVAGERQVGNISLLKLLEARSMQSSVDAIGEMLPSITDPMERIQAWMSSPDYMFVETKGITDVLKELGYDGFKAQEMGENSWGAFYPEQIKSATANVGTFDIDNADIRFMANDMPGSAADEIVDDIHRGIGDTDTSIPNAAEKEAWRATRTRNPRQRNPELQAELLKYMRGGSQQDYLDAVRRLMPIQLIRSMPKMPTWKEIQSALSDEKAAKGIIGANKQIKDGERVGTRLDIPSYDKYDTWTVTVHAPNSNTSVHGYGKAAKLSNVDFTSSPTGAISTALGGQKNSYAKMVGNWVDETPESIYKQAQDAMNNPEEWIQVGMNPERHSWFYIKEPLGDMPAGTPVKSAKEVLQVGPLVMVKREGLTTAGKLENGKLVVDDPEFMTNLKALPEDAQNVRFMANGTPKLTLKQKLAQNTPSAAALNKAVNSWVSQAGSVGDAILDAIDSGANILMSFPFVRATVALFDAAVMGATSSVKAQDEARLVYDTIQKAIEQTRGAIVPLVRAIEGSEYFDIAKIKSTLNITQEEASSIANQRAMQLRAAAEGIDSMYYNTDELPVPLRSVVTIINQLYEDALKFEANEAGLDISQLEDVFANYTFRESRKPGKRGATRNPFSGPQFDTRFPSQQGRKEFLTNLPGGTSVIDELSLDERLSGLVNRVPVRAKNRKAAQAFPENIAFVVDKNGVKTVDPLNLPMLRQYLYENYGPKLDADLHNATQDALNTLMQDNPNATWQDAWKVAQEQLAETADESVEGGLLLFDPAKDKRFDSMINWLVNLDAGYVRENQPIYGRNLLHDTMMRVEDGQKAGNIAMMAQKLMGQALSKIDASTGISLATEEAPGVAWRTTMESFRMDTPVAHQRILDNMSEASRNECAEELTRRANHIYDEIKKALTSKKVIDADKTKTITGSVSSRFNGKEFKYQIRNVDGENVLYKVETVNGVEEAKEVLMDFVGDSGKSTALEQLEREYKATNNVAFLSLHHMPEEMHNDITRWMKPFSVPEEIGIFRNVLDSLSNVFRANVTGPFPSFHGRNLMSATVQNIIYRAYDPTQIGPMRYLKPMLDARKVRKDETIDGIYDSIATSAGDKFVNGLLTAEDFANFKDTRRKQILLALVDAQQSGNKTIAAELQNQLKELSALKDDDPKFRDMLMTRKISDLAFQYGITGAKQGQSAEVIGDTYNALASQLPGLDKTSALDLLRGKIPDAPPNARLLDVVNPLAVQGGMSPFGTVYDADFYILARAGRMVGKSIEDTVRLAPFIAYIKQGYLPEVAADMVKRNQIDYSRLSSFERKYARSYFPFYTYSSRILASTAKDLLQNPGGRQAQLIRTINNARDNDAMAPEYIQSSASIPLGRLPDGSDRYITGFGLGLEDAAKFSKLLQGDVQGTARELFSRSNPLAKYAGELAFGRSAFYDGPEGAQSLSDLDPPIGRTLSNIRDLATGERTERAEPFISQGFEHLMSNSPFARYGTFARQLTDPRKLETPLASATDLLTGIKVKDVSPAAQDSIAMQRAGMKFRELGGRNQSIPFMPKDKIDKLSPEDRQSVEAIQQLLKDVKERRKARREMEEARVNEVR